MPIDKPDVPLHTYHLDHIGPLPSTVKRYKHIFVIVDAFSKFTWMFPVKNTAAEEVVKKMVMLSEIFGNPHRVISDRGAAFVSNNFKDYCEAEKICHHLTTTGVPRGNGQVERLNKVVIEVLSKASVEDPTKWYKHVPKIQRIINSTTSRSTGRSPFELLTGVKRFSPEDLKLKQILEEELIAIFEQDRRDLREQAKEQIQRTQEENRKGYDKKRKEAQRYHVGDLVAVQRTQFGAGLKLYPKFLGPYEVTKVNRGGRYQLKKVGQHEGPNSTSSAADYMKPWKEHGESDSEGSSGSDEEQDGRV